MRSRSAAGTASPGLRRHSSMLHMSLRSAAPRATLTAANAASMHSNAASAARMRLALRRQRPRSAAARCNVPGRDYRRGVQARCREHRILPAPCPARIDDTRTRERRFERCTDREALAPHQRQRVSLGWSHPHQIRRRNAIRHRAARACVGSRAQTERRRLAASAPGAPAQRASHAQRAQRSRTHESRFRQRPNREAASHHSRIGADLCVSHRLQTRRRFAVRGCANRAASGFSKSTRTRRSGGARTGRVESAAPHATRT